VLIVATIVGILVTVGTVQYLEVKRRAKEKLATQKLSQLATYERFYYRDNGEYATFDELREEGYIDYNYIYEDDELQHYHRPVYIPEYTLDFLLDEEGGGFRILAEPVLTEAQTWYPRWVALGGIPDLRSQYVEEDGVVKWADSNRPIY
jgi:type II secretory pathway pseudopilin PulG